MIPDVFRRGGLTSPGHTETGEVCQNPAWYRLCEGIWSENVDFRPLLCAISETFLEQPRDI